MTDALDYEAIAERARQLAEKESELLYPHDMAQERRQAYEAAYIKFYRQMTQGRSSFQAHP